MKDQDVHITTRDVVLRAWDNTKELIRDFVNYSKEVEDKDAVKIFEKTADDLGKHASDMREWLLSNQQ